MMGIEWRIEGCEECEVQILPCFFVTDDGSEEEIQRSVELSGECSLKTYTHTRGWGEK